MIAYFLEGADDFDKMVDQIPTRNAQVSILPRDVHRERRARGLRQKAKDWGNRGWRSDSFENLPGGSFYILTLQPAKLTPRDHQVSRGVDLNIYILPIFDFLIYSLSC